MKSKDLADELRFYSELGVTHLNVAHKDPSDAPEEAIPAGADPPSPAQPEGTPPSAQVARTTPSAPPPEPTAPPPPSDEPDLPDKALTMNEIRRVLGDCQRCPLCKTRKQIVFGVGDPQADLMFVGEAPGADEDSIGLPFVGRAGALLSKIVLAIDLYRDQVYVANILKCRPPDNRDPLPEEVEKCEPFVLKQIETVSPKVIVALGRYATQTLLRTKRPMRVLRGQFADFRGIPVMPTYHPSYLLRNPPAKREVWEDMKKVRDRLRDV